LTGGSGTYQVYVVQFALPRQLTEQVAKAHLFLVGSPLTGNLTVAPKLRQVVPDQSMTFEVAWHGLDPARRYLGLIEFGDGTAARAWTTVAIGPQPPTVP
jgi:hypothetical protein